MLHPLRSLSRRIRGSIRSVRSVYSVESVGPIETVGPAGSVESVNSVESAGFVEFADPVDSLDFFSPLDPLWSVEPLGLLGPLESVDPEIESVWVVPFDSLGRLCLLDPLIPLALLDPFFLYRLCPLDALDSQELLDSFDPFVLLCPLSPLVGIHWIRLDPNSAWIRWIRLPRGGCCDVFIFSNAVWMEAFSPIGGREAFREFHVHI